MFTFLTILEQDFRNYLYHKFKQQGKNEEKIYSSYRDKINKN